MLKSRVHLQKYRSQAFLMSAPILLFMDRHSVLLTVRQWRRQIHKVDFMHSSSTAVFLFFKDSTFNDVAAVLSKLEPSSGGTSVIEAQAVGMHNTGEFTALVDELSEWLIGQGVTNLWRLQFEEKEAVVKDLFVHHIYHRVQSCIQQFTDGLGPLYGEMRRHPKALGSLFVVDNKPLSLPSFRKLYDIEYSAQGSNNRNREDTIYCWELFLQRAEEKDEVTLEKILEFWTGAGKPPPAGFNHKLHIQFFSQETGVRRLPSSSTWAMVLWLPRGVEDPQQFQAMMTNAILETQGFGKM
ncbi:uncharacterized protein LOC110988173 isoform X4 [Acanthaster planci]|uniref:Uncharacterized protein LOC110988173 isoform X4 n=1 Tax=Acanthaster planci TaxID=133434 RepID=A0A8B7ZP09_ACAPL|nr:uncharacterized protein LOC110988173 isoform X4 [Acanthaster planci]